MKQTMITAIVGSIILVLSVPALGHFAITYYDNYNYETDQWDGWIGPTPMDAWDAKYLADDTSGNTVFTDHKLDTIAVFDLRNGFASKDGHATGGTEDWNPVQSNGDNSNPNSPHHVFAAVFKGLIYLEEGDTLMVASDDDVFVYLDDDASPVLSIPIISFFLTDSIIVSAAQEGLHTITVKYIERQDIHSGIEMKLNGEHLQNAEAFIDIKPGSCPNPFNPKSKGSVPVAFVSTESFDATSVDPTTVILFGPNGEAYPLEETEDVDSTEPYDNGGCDDCFDAEANFNCVVNEEDAYCGDGYTDRVVKFLTQDLVAAIGPQEAGACVKLTVTGQTYDGVPISGSDFMVIKKEIK